MEFPQWGQEFAWVPNHCRVAEMLSMYLKRKMFWCFKPAEEERRDGGMERGMSMCFPITLSLVPHTLRYHTCYDSLNLPASNAEAHTWESRAEEDAEEKEKAARELLAAEDDSYLAYDEACKVRQLSPRGWQEGYYRTSKSHVTRSCDESRTMELV
ncbi:hypothetical protein EI94DRAFT_1700559 [Lactarius quietus]|nr:hypothetical protein EI94DRAFT_1700559 [Lactarius quietus]